MKLSFEQLKHEDRSTIEYELLKLQMVLHHQKPDEVIRIQDKKKVKYIVLKTSEISGQTTTKSIVLPLAESPFFDSSFCADFPDVPLTVYNSQKGGVADEPSKDIR